MWRSSHHAPGRPDARGLRDPACALEKYLCPRGVLGPSLAQEVFWKADPCGRIKGPSLRDLRPGGFHQWVSPTEDAREDVEVGIFLPLPPCQVVSGEMRASPKVKAPTEALSRGCGAPPPTSRGHRSTRQRFPRTPTAPILMVPN